MLVDAHTHIFPPQVVAERGRFLAGEPAFAAIYADVKAPMVTAEGLVAAMDGDGVGVSWALGFPWRQEAHARLHNDYLARALEDHPGRLRALGCLAVGQPWARAEAERALGLGLHGLGELACYDSDLDLNGLAPLCRLCAEADVPLLLHTNEPVGHAYPGKSPMTLAALYALLKAHPRTKLVLAHMAGGLFFYATLKKEASQVLANAWLDTAAAPFLYRPRVYALAVELLGAQKVLLGSDYPLLPVSRYQRELAQANLAEDDLRLVLGQAAARLLP
jgi:hypothetical protein